MYSLCTIAGLLIPLPFASYLGARFEFVLDEELKEAASCDDVRDALAAKISRERIGTEVSWNLSMSQVVVSLIIMHLEFKFYLLMV